MNPYVILGALILLGISHGYVFVKGGTMKDNEYKAALLVAEQKARDIEKTWQGAANAIVVNLGQKQAATQRSLDVALNGLRDRPERNLSRAPGTDCKGTSGAELSRSDAIFLTRLAARGDRLQAALDACYAYADKVK